MIRWILLLFLTLLITILPTWLPLSKIVATTSPAPTTSEQLFLPEVTEEGAGAPTSPTAQTLWQQGKQNYQQGEFTAALNSWQQALQISQQQNQPLPQAFLLNYLSLAYQHLEQWQNADNAITQSLNILSTQPPSPEQSKILARAYNTQGQLQVKTGKNLQSLDSFNQAIQIYQNLEDTPGIINTQLNQAETLRTLGVYRRALKILADIETRLDTQPNDTQKALQLHSLGNILRATGDLERANNALETSFNLTEQPLEKINLLIDLGNTQLALAERQRSSQQIIPPRTPLGCVQTENEFNSEAILSIYKNAESQYQKAAQYTQTGKNWQSIRPQIDLNLFHLYVILSQLYPNHPEYQQKALTIWEKYGVPGLTEIATQPLLSLNLATNITCLKQQNSAIKINWQDIDHLLQTASDQATLLDNHRLRIEAIGKQGALHEIQQDFTTAQHFTETALNLATIYHYPDLLYQWQWQMGRLQKQHNNPEKAIIFYDQAVKTLETVREGLNGINLGFRAEEEDNPTGLKIRAGTLQNLVSPFDHPRFDIDLPFDFRAKVEPVYRELIELLLSKNNNQPLQEDIVKSRDLILQLQDAELQSILLCDFGQNTETIPIHQFIDQNQLTDTAIIYPIILQNKIAVITKIPLQVNLEYQESEIKSVQSFSRKIKELYDVLSVSNTRFLLPDSKFRQYASNLYQIIIHPISDQLFKNHVENLVFVLDSQLRNIPMSVLYNEENGSYLIEKYSISVNLGRIERQSLKWSQVQVNPILSGFNDAKNYGGMGPLNLAEEEAQEISKILKSQNPKTIIGDEFTKENFQQEINANFYNLIHIVTHGQFSSIPKDTFLLTAPTQINQTSLNNRVNLNELDNLLRNKIQTATSKIELLVLSACQTAQGDNRATLGLAGVAIRAGASATIGSLWKQDDREGYKLMIEFYQELGTDKTTKAKALQKIQKKFLRREIKNKTENIHPALWANFVLLGNWL